MRATRVGTETTLGQIRRMVEEAKAQRASLSRRVTRAARASAQQKDATQNQ